MEHIQIQILDIPLNLFEYVLFHHKIHWSPRQLKKNNNPVLPKVW